MLLQLLWFLDKNIIGLDWAGFKWSHLQFFSDGTMMTVFPAFDSPDGQTTEVTAACCCKSPPQSTEASVWSKDEYVNFLRGRLQEKSGPDDKTLNDEWPGL